MAAGPLFQPFRALGYITEDVPFAVQRRGKETYITVSVGRTWQVRLPTARHPVAALPHTPHPRMLAGAQTPLSILADLQHSKVDTCDGGTSGWSLFGSCTRTTPLQPGSSRNQQLYLWGCAVPAVLPAKLELTPPTPTCFVAAAGVGVLLLQLPRAVTALACKGDVTFAAAGGVIHEAKRSTP